MLCGRAETSQVQLETLDTSVRDAGKLRASSSRYRDKDLQPCHRSALTVLSLSHHGSCSRKRTFQVPRTPPKAVQSKQPSEGAPRRCLGLARREPEHSDTAAGPREACPRPGAGTRGRHRGPGAKLSESTSSPRGRGCPGTGQRCAATAALRAAALRGTSVLGCRGLVAPAAAAGSILPAPVAAAGSVVAAPIVTAGRVAPAAGYEPAAHASARGPGWQLCVLSTAGEGQ